MNSNKLPKILAIYLPQFYENEDNNRWWGKGFTEWESVKTAEKYFPEHNEPRVPLEQNYYDLSKKETMLRQAELAHMYGVDGFCFYHYYFKDGKKELEVPAENLLKWKDIDMPFCFNWANEAWVRSWSRIGGNSWTEKGENIVDECTNGILVEQDYGNQEAWVKHFEYLLPFFQDERYIKIDGKPIFIFYRPNDIKRLDEMVCCWRDLAIKSGLKGLYFIASKQNLVPSCLDATIIHEPRNSMNKLNEQGKLEIKSNVRCYEYKEICERINEEEPVYGVKTYFCGVTGYDDTPRRGKYGESLIHSSPDIFEQELRKLIQKSIYCQNEILFVNAWNEWGEGMYLEPDETNGYKYLDAIKSAVNEVYDMKPKDIEQLEDEKMQIQLREFDYQVKKYKLLYEMLDKWLFFEQENKLVFTNYLKEHHISSVAIYGMGTLGKHLFIQLKKEKVNALFGIDRYVGKFEDDFIIYRPEDNFPDVDAIIITAYDVDGVKKQLCKKYKGKIIALETLLTDAQL